MTGREVETLLRAAARLWPSVPNQAPIDAATVRLWGMVLADVPYDAAQLVLVTRSRAGDRFPPTPGAIVQHFHDARDLAQGTTVPDVDEAWSEVVREIGRVGWYGTPLWSHDAIERAVIAIGWNALCHGDEMISRAHFVKLYPTVAARARQHQVQERTFDALGISTTRVFGEIEA